MERKIRASRAHPAPHRGGREGGGRCIPAFGSQIRTVALGGRKAAPVGIAPAPLSFRALASRAKLFRTIWPSNFEHVHRQSFGECTARSSVLDFEGANEREGLRCDAQARLRNRRPAQRPEHPSASSATGWAVAISVVGRDWHDRHHYLIATITVRITIRPDKASWRSRIDLADSGAIWPPAGLVPFPRMELRLIGLGVCISAIGGGHARNDAGWSADRRGGKENRQCVIMS